MTFVFKSKKKQIKIDKVVKVITNYEELDSYNLNINLVDPYSDRREKHLTDKLIEEQLIDNEFLIKLSCLSAVDLLIIKFESVYKHLDIKTNISTNIFLKNVEDSLLMYRRMYTDVTQLEKIMSDRTYRKYRKNNSDAKK